MARVGTSPPVISTLPPPRSIGASASSQECTVVPGISVHHVGGHPPLCRSSELQRHPQRFPASISAFPTRSCASPAQPTGGSGLERDRAESMGADREGDSANAESPVVRTPAGACWLGLSEQLEVGPFEPCSIVWRPTFYPSMSCWRLPWTFC
jgi:hypothetical protein